jgi:predicted metal-dependent phosphoesterase TrpH
MHVKILDERVVQRAKTAGLDVLVYAPHFTRLPEIRERAERFSDDDLLVVPAREIFTGDWRSRRHLLAVGLDEPVPDFITFESALSELDRQDAATLVPHPELMNVSLTRSEIGAYRERIHGVESMNAKLFSYQNERAERVVEAFDLPTFGSSYAHVVGTIGAAWTEFEREITSESDLVAALREGVSRTLVKRTDPATKLRRLVEFAHLGYENSWGKLDRLFLSGMEPTHPRHIAYDGRFDDVAMY